LRQTRLQLETLWAQIEDATRDTLLWLSSASAQERVCVSAMQARLTDLHRILERRLESRAYADDNKLWNLTVRDFLLAFGKAKEARGTAVGRNLARLAAQFKPALARENNTATSGPVDGNRARIDAFIGQIAALGLKVTRKNIWTVAGYTDRSEFQRFQNGNRMTKTAKLNFDRVLRMTWEEFRSALRRSSSSK
jgi:hypothetical protein